MSATIIKEHGDGLILRRTTEQDTGSLAEFNSHIHSHNGWGKPDLSVAAWTRDMMLGRHPSVTVADFTIVEDSKTGKIISSMNLISQVWGYAGISFKVSQPEIVGTHPDYLHRRLAGEQFALVHDR